MNTDILYFILGFASGTLLVIPSYMMYLKTVRYKNRIINALHDEIDTIKNK
jgi:hypothetical protein